MCFSPETKLDITVLEKKWAQNAVVWGEIGEAAELLVIAAKHYRM
jgi:hypothetical protein